MDTIQRAAISTQAQEAVEALILLSTEMLHWANEDKEWIEGKK
jgi:hypothetical protein